MFLCIKNLAGGLFYINNVLPSTTILDIKQRLSQLCETYDIILQRLSIIEEQGNFILLNNDQTLEYYNIKDEEQQICLYIEEFFYMPPAPQFLEMTKLYKCNTQPLLERLHLTVGKIYPFRLNDMNYIHRRQAYSDEYHTFMETTPQVYIGIYETYKTDTHFLPLHCHISGQVQSIQLFVIGQDANGDPIPVGGYIKLIHPIECYTEDGSPYHIDAIHSPTFESIILYLQCIDEVIN